MLQATFISLKWCSLSKLASWKQPCDMKTIAALKKFLYLNDVSDFYELINKLKAHKKEQANRPLRGAADAAHGNSVH